METLLVFVFRYALQLILAWIALSFMVSVAVGAIIRRMDGR